MDGGVMAEMHLSSDFGLQWGNVTITPSELAQNILGIDLVDGLLVFDGVKVVNDPDREYITDSRGDRYMLVDLVERILGK